MKQEFTIDEVAKIFGQAVKVVKASQRLVEITDKYNEKDAIFGAEFAKYDYTFFNAPKELHDMFEEKSALMKERDNAGRKAYRAIKEFGDMIEIGGERSMDIVEDCVKLFLENKYYFQAPDMVDRVKHLASMASRRINWNA